MEHYLINSTASLFVLWLFYKLTLENTSWHQFKRFYLIAALVVAAIIPLITTQVTYVESAAAPVLLPVEFFMGETGTQTMPDTAQEPDFNWWNLLYGVLAVGSLLMLIRLVIQLQKFKIQPTDEVRDFTTYSLVLREALQTPFSFLRRIYLDKKSFKNDRVPDCVLRHEQAHVEQLHSMDILFIELLLLFLWWHPVVHLMKQSIILNHEFLADRAALEDGIPVKDYQNTLLAYATTRSLSPAHSLGFPIIKKRLQIMKTKTSNKTFLLRSSCIIPVLAVLLMACGKEDRRSAEPSVIEEAQNYPFPGNSGGNQTVIEEGGTIYAEPGEEVTADIYYKDVDFIVYEIGIQYTDTILGKNEIFRKKYEDLTKADIKKYKLSLLINAIPKPIAIRKTTQEEMNEFLDAKVFRIWIDGEEVDNSVLKNYQPEDFKTYSGRMFVHKTGRKTHPQAFNVHFSTPSYYEKMNRGKQVKYYGGDQVAQYITTEKKRGFFKNPMNEDFNLPQKIAAAAAHGSANKTIFYIDNKPFTYQEAVSKLANISNPSIKIQRDRKDRPAMFIDTKTTVSDKDLIEMLDLLQTPPPPPPAPPATQKKKEIKKNNSRDAKPSKKVTAVQNGSWKDVQEFVENTRKKPSDFELRNVFLLSSTRQQKPVKFLIDGKTVDYNQVQELITENNTVYFELLTKNENEHTLSYDTKSSEVLSFEEIEKMYAKISKTVDTDKNKTAFVAVQDWQIETIDATKKSGAFTRKGKKYTYDSSDLNSIKVIDDKGNTLNKEQFKNLRMGFNPIWVNGEKKYKEVMKKPEVIKGFKNGTYAVFYWIDNKPTYTKDYEEALKIDASNTFLSFGSTLEGKTIGLDPHSWAKTNPGYSKFKDQVE